jgi:hypothetical protein
MASLAIIVSIIFLTVLVSGPIALLLSKAGFRVLGAFAGVFALLVGGYWLCVAPFPVSLIGGLSAVCGAMAINKI